MREIKFRAWAMVGGKQRMYEMPDLFLIDGVYWINLKDEPLTRQLIEIDGTETILEQYTGLKDKNGNEIYEGDITDPDDCIYAVCTFQDGSFGWTFYEQGDPDPIEFDTMTSLLLDKVEIIGNINENPTILEN